MLGGLKKMIKGWLEIQDGQNEVITINEKMNFDVNCIKNKIWMRGDPSELEQFYKQVYNQDAMFWGSVPHVKMRKIHTGLPSIIVETLSGIVKRDMNGIELDSRQAEWDEIARDNNFNDIIEKSVAKALYLGDGAFKISFDSQITDKPIIEFYGADDVKLVYKRGRFKEAIFKTIYEYDHKRYVHYETYGYGYIKNKLVTAVDDKEVPLKTIPQTRLLADWKYGGYEEDNEGVMISPGTFCMAIPFRIIESTKYANRGKAIYDTKTGMFDAFDEVVSQWMDALRAGRSTKYIPENLLPRNPRTGEVMQPNDFDNRYIASGSDMSENARNTITVTQPAIPSDNYLETYISCLDNCLQGIISPSTLGIDTKKLDNAEAQREKEKTTMYTRNKIINALQDTLVIVVNSTLKSVDALKQVSIGNDIDVTINFGEYANPSFEAVVETVAKAKTGGVMSIEASVDELYGDSKDEEWKKEEVARLKEEAGISELEEPAVNNVEGGNADDSNNPGAFLPNATQIVQ